VMLPNTPRNAPGGALHRDARRIGLAMVSTGLAAAFPAALLSRSCPVDLGAVLAGILGMPAVTNTLIRQPERCPPGGIL